MRISPIERIAAVALVAEAGGIAALVGWEIVALVSADTTSIVNSLALIVLTAIAAVALVAFAVAVWRDRSWGRSGGIVAQLLILAVALGAATGPAPNASLAILLAAIGAVGLIVLIGAARAAGRRAASVEPEELA